MIDRKPRLRTPMPVTFRGIVEPICRSSSRHPAVWLLAILVLSVPSALTIRQIRLDTDLVRLLPTTSPAARWTRALQKEVGDEGYFTILFEGSGTETLLAAVRDTAARVRAMDGVLSAEYEYPLEFIERYRYLLVPNYYLERILDYLIGLEAEVSPVGEDLLGAPAAKGSKGRREDAEMKELLDRYGHLTSYHQSRDGRVMGLFVRPQVGLTSLAELRGLWLGLKEEAAAAAAAHGIWAGVGGSQTENLAEFDVIVRDLRLSGTIATVLMILFLILSFRRVRTLPIVFFPLGVGLLWSFSLVPPVLGSLNIITSFLVLVLFGMGIDFSIHLVKRFEIEAAARSAEEALVETYASTGASVMISGMTTALALLVLALSAFRGFSEYGLICGAAISLVLLAMLVVMPATLALGHRLRWIRPVAVGRRAARLPPRPAAAAVGAALVASVVLAAFGLRFNYDFNALKPDPAESRRIAEAAGSVYSRYMSPGAVYVAPDLASLDAFLEVLDAERRRPSSLIQRVANIRDLAPNDKQAEDRFELVGQIKDQVAGSWTRRIEDAEARRWVDDLRAWEPPVHPPRLDEVPESLESGYVTRDGSGQLVVGVYPSVPRGNGRNAMRFTKELYGLEAPAGIKGPVGEMPVFAEILWVVGKEGPWVVAATFLSVFLLVLLGNRSVRETVWTVLPMVGGIVLTFGAMAAVGLRLNFFSVVVIPTLIGLGEDHGVHYYRRWKELGRDTASVHRELLNPLTACTVTTMLGYSGMMFASHPGLRSIGLFAVLGMVCIWLTSLVLFPAVLERQRRRHAIALRERDP
jgi:predicted RND superfamily exporter protein